LDTDVERSTEQSYKLGAVDAVGRETLFGPFTTGSPAEAELSFALTNLSPNPSAEGAHLRYSLPAKSVVRLDVYSVAGRRVRTLVAGDVEAGVWDAPWDGRDDRGHEVASGVYFVKLEAGAQRRGLKITLLR
jgi:flagellar hook assembly protein FlgD